MKITLQVCLHSAARKNDEDKKLHYLATFRLVVSRSRAHLIGLSLRIDGVSSILVHCKVRGAPGRVDSWFFHIKATRGVNAALKISPRQNSRLQVVDEQTLETDGR